MNKGLALDNQGKHDEAIAAYDKAIQLDPNYALIWINKGVALYNQGKYDKAVQALDKVIELDPYNAFAWRLKGNVLKPLGKTSEADTAFAKAKELENIEPNEFISKLNYNYELIDQYVLKENPPASVKKSVKELATFLTAPSTNDREKARAIYRWITENINYDVEGLSPISMGILTRIMC